MFSVYLNWSLSWPALKSKLLWKGTLMSDAIGLESCFARASALAAPPVALVSAGLGDDGVWAYMRVGSRGRADDATASTTRAASAAPHRQVTTTVWSQRV